ncbi:MAG: FxsA family protein [Deltaproteobacteria bacterium]|nr:FxsA family protein [Deltaproteobacteria bacterium]
MLLRLLLLFTIVPLIELYFLIKIGSAIGALNTIVLILGTAILGSILVRWQGLKTMQQIMSQLSQNKIPAEEMVDAVLIFVGGVMLITPGILTDFLALFLVFPYTRTLFKRWLRRKFDRMVASGNVRLNFRGGDWRDI